MMKFINQLIGMHFHATVAENPAVFKEDEDSPVHSEICKANNVREDDLMVTTTIIDSASGADLYEGIKVTIDGAVYTYSTCVGYIPLSVFPFDGDMMVQLPMEISDEFGHSIYTTCPVILYHHDAGRVEGKTVTQRIIEAMMYYCR